MPSRCPRCNAAITAAPDPAGFVVCAQCGAKLRKGMPAGAKAPAGLAGPADHEPPAAAAASPSEIDAVLARLDAPPSPAKTLPPGTPLKKIPQPGEVSPSGEPTAVAAPTPATLEAVLSEIRALRRTQEEILGLLRAGRGSGAAAGEDPFAGLVGPASAPPRPVVRSQRRKMVLLIDDDPVTRYAAVAALQKADVPVRTVADGNEALAAIAEDRPDVVVLELDLAGAMAGRDVINVIKATMEWVDLPIILHTRVPIESQKEARTVHGADEYVLKGDGSPDRLVSRVIAQFRKG